MNNQPRVAIVVLNFNRAAATIECLKSLSKISYTNYGLVVVDNASTDGSSEQIEGYLKSSFFDFVSAEPEAAVHSDSRCVFIQSKRNSGYGAGNNLGIRWALRNKAEYVLVLNNDTVVDADFLSPLVSACMRQSGIGIAGARIYYHDFPDVFWFNGGYFSQITGRLTHRDFGKKDTGQKTLEDGNFITGCVWLVPREVFEKAGLIAEDYFMYVEDLEFCRRVLDCGYRLKVVPESRVWHKVPIRPSADESLFSLYWTGRNRIKFAYSRGCYMFGLNAAVIEPIKVFFRFGLPGLKAWTRGIRDAVVCRRKPGKESVGQ